MHLRSTVLYMSGVIDTLHSGKIDVDVIDMRNSTPLTAISESTDHNNVFVIEMPCSAPVQEQYLSYDGLERLADKSEFESKSIASAGDDICAYCCESVDKNKFYSVDDLPVFTGHKNCLLHFTEDMQEILQKAHKYVVSSEI